MTRYCQKALGIVVAGLLAAMLAGLGGCASRGTAWPKPAQADARKVFENTDPLMKDETTKINSFWEVRGRERAIPGIRRFSVDYEVEVEYLKDALPYRKGDRKKHEVTIDFDQSDKGWKANDGNVY